jgi:transposase
VSSEAAILKQENERLKAELAELRPRAAELAVRNEALSDELAWFRRYFLSRRTDRLPNDDGQSQLPFDEAEAIIVEEEPQEEAVERQTVASHTRAKPRHKRFPEDLPREERVLDIPEDDKQCACGSSLNRIGEETSEKLDVVPPRVRVVRTIRPRYACKSCEGSGDEERPAVRIAPVEPTIIPRALITARTLAYIVVSKFVDALPLYRQQKQFERMGVDISRRTMADWMIAAARACAPVMEALQRSLRSGPAMLVDETTVQVLQEPERPNTAKSYVWATYGGSPEHTVVTYRYEQSRSAEVAKEIIKDFSGFVQTDGFSGYAAAITGKNKIRHVGCLAHLRRKFVDAGHVGGNNGSVREALSIISKIYAMEKELAGRTRDEKLRNERDKRVRPLLDKLQHWLEEKAPRVPPSSALGKAVGYALEHLPRVERYLESPHLTPDTNRVENAIRPFVVGRKNWLFSGGPNGAHASMTLYSLIETAKANHVEPYWYLHRLFDRLPTFDGDYADLLPWTIDRPSTD